MKTSTLNLILLLLLVGSITVLLFRDESPQEESHVEAATEWIYPGQTISNNHDIRFGGILAGTTDNNYESFSISIEQHSSDKIVPRYFFMNHTHGTFKMYDQNQIVLFNVKDVDFKNNRIQISATEQ